MTRTGSRVRDTAIRVTGVWLQKDFSHLDNQIRVLVEVDGVWRLLGEWTNDDSCISHIVELSGIRSAAAAFDKNDRRTPTPDGRRF